HPLVLLIARGSLLIAHRSLLTACCQLSPQSILYPHHSVAHDPEGRGGCAAFFQAPNAGASAGCHHGYRSTAPPVPSPRETLQAACSAGNPATHPHRTSSLLVSSGRSWPPSYHHRTLARPQTTPAASTLHFPPRRESIA